MGSGKLVKRLAPFYIQAETIMAKLLKYISNPRLIHVAVAKKPANKKTFVKIIKSAEADAPVGYDTDPIEYTVNVTETDREKRIVYGEVYTPYQIDKHNMFTTPDMIESMAHAFITQYRDHAVHMNNQHVQDTDKLEVVESFIADGNNDKYTDGAWVLGTKFHDDRLWGQVESGELTGYSLQAYAEVYDVEPDTNGMILLPDGRKIPQTLLTKQEAVDNAVEEPMPILHEIKTILNDIKKIFQITKSEGTMPQFGELIKQWEVNSNIDDGFELLRYTVRENLFTTEMTANEKKKLLRAEIRDFSHFVETIVDKEHAIIESQKNKQNGEAETLTD